LLHCSNQCFEFLFVRFHLFIELFKGWFFTDEPSKLLIVLVPGDCEDAVEEFCYRRFGEICRGASEVASKPIIQVFCTCILAAEIAIHLFYLVGIERMDVVVHTPYPLVGGLSGFLVLTEIADALDEVNK
jgi:hypothetical protein